MNNLRTNILKLAKKEGISIRQLEMKLGLSDKIIASWETRSAKIDNVVKVADYFHVSIDSLIGREIPVADENAELLAKFGRLSTEQKLTILSNIDFLLSQKQAIKDKAI